jgi:hypothetical protein
MLFAYDGFLLTKSVGNNLDSWRCISFIVCLIVFSAAPQVLPISSAVLKLIPNKSAAFFKVYY